MWTQRIACVVITELLKMLDTFLQSQHYIKQGQNLICWCGVLKYWPVSKFLVKTSVLTVFYHKVQLGHYSQPYQMNTAKAYLDSIIHIQDDKFTIIRISQHIYYPYSTHSNALLATRSVIFGTVTTIGQKVFIHKKFLLYLWLDSYRRNSICEIINATLFASMHASICENLICKLFR